MKILTNFLFCLITIISITEIYASQETDFFRSKASGNWYDITTWESSSDNMTWTNATLIPDNKANKVSILNSHTVSLLQSLIVDQLVVEAGAVLVVNGVQPTDTVRLNISNGPDEKDMVVHGRVVATGIPPAESPFSVNAVGVISFEEGSVYEHNQNGGGIPISVWQPGSTLILNAVTDTPPFNRGQDYSNIIVDLPDLTFHFNMGFRDNVISGDLTIVNTGVSRFVLVGPVTDSTRTVTFLGNINVSGGSLSSHGTENPNSHAVLHVFGDINVTGGNFSVIRGAQGGSGTTIWYLHGNLSISDAETQNSNPAGAKFVFKGPEDHTLTLNNVTYGDGGLSIEIDSSFLNLGTTVIRGNGMFALGPQSVLITAHDGGLDSALQTTGSIILSEQASYVFNGSNPQSTGIKLPDVVSNLSINNETGVLLSKNVQVNSEINIDSGRLLLNGFRLTLGSNAVLKETNGLVTGESGKIATTRDINAPANLDVAGMGVMISSAANLGTTTIERIHTPKHINGIYGIGRQYNIAPVNNSDLNATLRIYYHESELDTISENNLLLFSSNDGAGNTWEKRGGAINTEENYAEITGINGFSYWTLASSSGPVSVKDIMNEVPTEFSLYQNYPNPFNPETVIRFDLPEDSFVNLSVFNLLGEKVLTLINEKMNNGKYNKSFSAVNLPSGIYIYKLTADNFVFTRKMILMK